MVDTFETHTAARAPAVPVRTHDVAFNAGLRSYMLSVYNYMASGVLLTGIAALLFAQSGAATQVCVVRGS